MNPTPLTEADYVRQIDELLSHVWMIRAFLKHCEEAEEDDELRDVQRALYDFMLALGGPLRDGDDAKYLKQAKKKLKKLREADALFQEIQPEISSHTNFQMAAISLRISVKQVGDLIDDYVAQKKAV
ncbi:MAG: cob(I)alamin adenosyltransferase [Mariniblastus sp.]|jgi:cob(I)alamin adenosyltransferase